MRKDRMGRGNGIWRRLGLAGRKLDWFVRLKKGNNRDLDYGSYCYWKTSSGMEMSTEAFFVLVVWIFMLNYWANFLKRKEKKYALN